MKLAEKSSALHDALAGDEGELPFSRPALDLGLAPERGGFAPAGTGINEAHGRVVTRVAGGLIQMLAETAPDIRRDTRVKRAVRTLEDVDVPHKAVSP